MGIDTKGGMHREEILLVYDKQCPLCEHYCRAIKILESVGDLKIIDARINSDAMDEITAQGINIDQGIVLKMAGQLYHGADARHVLSLISTGSGSFNRLNYWLFKSKIRSFLLYPVLRFFRNGLLLLLGKPKIANLGKAANDKN